MKRVKAACICQTLHFIPKEGAEPVWAAEQVKRDVETYKKGLDRNHTKYKILDESTQADGTVIMKIVKQYNASPVGDYLETLGK